MGTEYTPPPSLAGFLTSDKFVNLVVGPYGSCKTSAGIIKIAYEAKRVAPCKDGIRRSKAAWVRNTKSQLLDTSIPDVLKWYPDGLAGAYMKTDGKFLLRFDDVECEVLFRGLDDSQDLRRLLSLQLSFGVMDEFREINKDVFEGLTGRIGRYPDKSMNGVGCCDDYGNQIDKIWGMTNPPDYDTYWEQMLSNPPDNWSVFIQPSGMSPEADWLHYLKPDYYESMSTGKSQDWIDVYIHAKFGKSLAGAPVFRCFDRNTHVAKEPLTPLPMTPVVIGVDAGLNPTAVLTQQTYDGRIMVLDAITGSDGGMGAVRFIAERLKPLLANKYAGKNFIIIIDPAAFQRAQTDERSVADIFKAEGFLVKPAKTNSIAARLAAGEKYLTKTINGNAGMLIDPGAKGLITALAGKYRYKMNTKGETADTPEKNHPFSDYADSLTYACLHHDGGGLFGGQGLTQRREIKPAPVRFR